MAPEESRVRAMEVEGGWLLRLDVGEKLPVALATFCEAKGMHLLELPR